MAFLDLEGLERLWTKILLKFDGKVDKVDGKSLSTNDYTDEEKAKVTSIQSVSSTYINGDGELIISYTDGSEANLGKVVGDPGNTPSVSFRYDEETGNLYYEVSDAEVLDEEAF